MRVTRYSSLVLSVIQSNIQTGIINHQTSVLWKSSHFVLCAILMHISVKSHEYQVYTTHNSQVERHKADANLASYMTRKNIYSMLHVNQSCMLNATHTLQIFFPCTPNLRWKNAKCIWEAENITLNNCIYQLILTMFIWQNRKKTQSLNKSLSSTNLIFSKFLFKFYLTFLVVKLPDLPQFSVFEWLTAKFP